jgi:hypothetical protein
MDSETGRLAGKSTALISIVLGTAKARYRVPILLMAGVMSVNVMRLTKSAVETATDTAGPVVTRRDFRRLVGLALRFIFGHGTGRFTGRGRATEIKQTSLSQETLFTIIITNG